MPDSSPEFVVTVIGAASGFSRLVCGKISDLPGMNRIRLQASFLIIGIVIACIPLTRSYWVLISTIVILGICDGCFITLIGPIVFDLLGTEGALQGLGAVFGLMAFPMTIGPPIAGLIYDVTKSYDIAFYVSGIPPITGAILIFFMPSSHPKHDNSDDVEINVAKDDIDITLANGCVNPSCGGEGDGHTDTQDCKKSIQCD